MAHLSSEQLAFLKKHNISPSLLFDATGLSKMSREKSMLDLDKQFYYGGAICKKGGHSLRSKAGHCIQCSTDVIAYQQRSSAAGYVYIAYSETTKLSKVGYSKFHPQDRGQLLRSQYYGNILDWDIKKIVKLDKGAGKAELDIHRALEQFQRPLVYEKTKGVFIECREIFDCDLAIVSQAFDEIAQRK